MEKVFKNNEYIYKNKQVTIPNNTQRKISLINYERKNNGNIIICEEFCYEGIANNEQKEDYQSKLHKDQNLKYIQKHKQHNQKEQK